MRAIDTLVFVFSRQTWQPHLTRFTGSKAFTRTVFVAGGYGALNPYYFLFSAALLRPGYLPAGLGFATTRAEPMEVRTLSHGSSAGSGQRSVAFATVGGPCDREAKLASLRTNAAQAVLSHRSHSAVVSPVNAQARFCDACLCILKR